MENLADGLRCHQAGDFPRAEETDRQILETNPYNGNARRVLGLLMQQQGRNDLATELLRQAASDDPTNAMVESNLGEVFRHMGRLDDAVACGLRAVQMCP